MRNPALSLARMDDWGDPYGTCMSHMFGICEALYWWGAPELVPAELEFRQSPMGGTIGRIPEDEDNAMWPDIEYANMLGDQDMSADDLVYALKVLNRMVAFVRLAGRDY